MSLPHALLTALLEHPCAGSELTKRFDRSIGYFWSATHQQIYRELHRLEAAGFIEAKPPENSRGRRKAYCVLPAGVEELKHWLSQQRDPKAPRMDVMVCLRAEAVVGPTSLNQVIAQRLQKHKDKLKLYREIETKDFIEKKKNRKQALQHLILLTGIRGEEMWIETLGDALSILETDDIA